MVIVIQSISDLKKSDAEILENELSEKFGCKVVILSPNLQVNTLQVIRD